VNAGYLKDEFVHVFLKRGQKRAPIINRGTYTRTYAIDRIITNFIKWNKKECQVVSLGAGSDSRFFNLHQANQEPKLYVEIDYPQVTSKKAMAVCKNATTKSMLSELRVEGGGTELVSTNYWLLSGDLIHFDRILERMIFMGLDTMLPTLFLSECVLVYLDSKVANAIVSATSTLADPTFVTYEQIEPNDPFGAQMMENLKVISD
jgi:O-methyltransferase involved in polyketide biosynthesis